ncbi:helix-turn-helix transcriptional regulator [Ruficoccus amylovorans]|uniref:Helix-turn-helix transcriptional regulator n=1 Tax=Ruficoccus amylovorans TaxID=1804625 RepID=A0A842HI38_9BACT|nr:AraC family transcriptional regulator [Ruficoccus amylovorans]MBC2596009.1 helix-turn-helix transcriptional regulator [Ruficoccus amylovorans]
MLRYLACGQRNFKNDVDPLAVRYSWEFYAILKGKGAPLIEGTTPLEPRGNCLWLMRPGIVYQWTTRPSRITRFAFHFSYVPEPLRNMFDDQDWLCRDLDEKEADTIRQLADDLLPHYHNPTELLDLHGNKALLTLSLYFLDDCNFKRQRPIFRREYERVRRAEEWYLDHIRQRPTMEQVAEQAGVSTSQMRRDFQTMYNVSPLVVFRRLRLYEATRLLMNTDLKIDNIYPLAGFSNAVDFHRNFKREYGLSPYQWRRRLTTYKADSSSWYFGQSSPGAPISLANKSRSKDPFSKDHK